jgi:hypothetical protein
MQKVVGSNPIIRFFFWRVPRSVPKSDLVAENARPAPERPTGATKPGSTPLGLEEVHRELKISPAQFDESRLNLGDLSGPVRRVAAETWANA